MERKEKAKFKKIIAILCVFVVLQSYISCFAQIAIAANEVLLGAENEEQQNQSETNLPFEQSELALDPLIGGKEETIAEESEENEEPAIGENLEREENLTEETTDEEKLEEEPAVETTENSNEEPTIGEEEPYVEPEVSIEVTSENSSIYKGYLYANATSELRYATNYNTIDVVTITGGKNMTSLTVQDEPDKMQLITTEKIGLMKDMYYRRTRVSVDEFHSLFGPEGSIIVYTPEGEILGSISKYSPIVNGEYVFEYSMQLNSVKFEMATTVADGTISIKNDKAIKETSEFNRNQISLFTTINTITRAQLCVGEEVKDLSAEGNINLEETESRMVIDVDTDTLSVEDKNQVAINVTLKTDEERYDLFENPIVDLEFPSAIEEIEVTGISLLYKNGLTIDSWNIITNAIGRKVLRINLAGSQLEYTPGAVQEGTTIVVYTELDVNRLTADTSEDLRMTYSNKNTVRKTYSLEGRDSENVSFSFVGRQELVRAMEIKTSEENKATSYDEEIEKIQINANEEQAVTITSSIVNNFEATITDVVIIGRIPFVGNKDRNGNDLGTNFDTKLKNAIMTSGAIADVYYSEDGLAEANSNSWSQDLENLENYKSYKIVVRGKALAKGEKVSFECQLAVPEETGYNAKGYSLYEVYYKIDTQNYTDSCSCGMYTETREVGMDDISEEERQEVAELTIGTQVSQCGIVLGETDSVYERQILKYTIIVSNTSKVTANNIVLRCNAENANLYDWEYLENETGIDEASRHVRYLKEFTNEEKEYIEFTQESLNPDETKIFEYQVIVKDLSEIENSKVYGKINIQYEDTLNKDIETIKNSVEEAELEVRVGYATTETIDDTDISTKRQCKVFIDVKNISGFKLENVELIFVLPKFLEFDDNSNYYGTRELSVDIETNEENKFIKFKIPFMDINGRDRFYLNTQTSNIDLDKENEKIEIYGYAQINNIKYYSNRYQKTLHQGKTSLEYSFTSDIDINTVLNDGDELAYVLDLKNIGKIQTGKFMISDMIPNGLKVLEVRLIQNNEERILNLSGSNRVLVDTEISAGNSIQVIIKTKLDKNLFFRDQEFIENQMEIAGGYIDSFKTNVISHRINNDNASVIIEHDAEYNQPGNEYYEDHSDEIIYDEYPDSHENSYDYDAQEDVKESTNNITDSDSSEIDRVQAYNISGLAWIDSNQDGIRQSNEKMKEGIVATLYKANSNGGLDTSRVIGETATDINGAYTFHEIENGNYIIVFDYNSSKYKLTKYQVNTAKSTENSDAISKVITINETSQILGITDVLTLDQGDLRFIDIGLVDKANFDLSLEKTISSVTVKNGAGTKTYTYNNSKNARLEIRSKYYKSTVLDIEYQFKVKNEGDISGYVNKIVDYLPDDVNVVLNSSPGWYVGSDNGLYYTGLVGKEIKVGETKEFTVVVRKSLANGEAVKIVNSAEIVESTNNQSLFDKDSIENNKMQTEDDYGSAILMISIATGNTVQYIIAILIIIIMICVIIMMVIKFKNTKKIYR